MKVLLLPASALLLALVSCAPGTPQLMPKETLFSLELGTLEDQIDLFQRPGLASPERSRFLFSDGLVLVSDGNARKVMELSSYGDLLTLYYNPDANPVPALVGTGSGAGQVKNRRAFAYPFAELGELALTDTNQMYVEDLVPSERRAFDPNLGAVLESRILRFDHGKFLDFLGQEGIGGTPFPLVDRMTVTSRGELAVLCRTSQGWAVWWYDRAGNPVDKAVLTFQTLPQPPNQSARDALLPQLETVFASSDRKLLLKVDYYRETMDPTTRTTSGVQSAQSRIWTYDLTSRNYQRSYALPLLKRLRSKDDISEPTGDRPYQFLGISEGGLGFFLSSPEAGNRRFLVCRSDGTPVLERNIAVDGSDALFAQYQMTRTGILVGFLSDGNRAQLAWWRSDKLLGTSAVTNF